MVGPCILIFYDGLHALLQIAAGENIKVKSQNAWELIGSFFPWEWDSRGWHGTLQLKFVLCFIVTNFKDIWKEFSEAEYHGYVHSTVSISLHIDAQYHGVVMRGPRKISSWSFFRWHNFKRVTGFCVG